MKVFALPPNENWICDRFVDEWYESNEDISTKNPVDADVIWLLADWCWNQLPARLLKQKKVLTSVHHIVPEKFGSREQQEFGERDKYTDAYHVPCEATKEQIQPYTDKPIYVQPFWVNGELWTDLTSLDDKHESGPMAPPHYVRRQRMKRIMGFSPNEFVIGTFQRDTEGSDLKSPKKEKGPDVLANFVLLAKESLKKSGMEPVVLLGGWRRQYLMRRLDGMGVRYQYAELPPFSEINRMYSCLDLYVVSARQEGGPQAIVECAITRTPIVSTNVGIASQILAPQSIAPEVSAEGLMAAVPAVEYAYEHVQPYLIPSGFSAFRDMLQSL